MPRTTILSTSTSANNKKNKTKNKSATGARMRTYLRIMLDDEIAFGPGKADLLEAIRDTGSISAAGKRLGMSYRRAWLLVDAMNRCFRAPLVETAAGGVAGGGAHLTQSGEEVVDQYRALEAAVAKITDKAFTEIKPLLRKTPNPPA